MKTKNILIGLGIFIAVVLLVTGSLYVFSPRTLNTITGACYGGLNILISTASHLPGQEFFHGEATANLGGECFKIAWTEQDVENYLAEGGDADRGVYGDIIIKSQSNTFNTYERTYEKIYYPRSYNVGKHVGASASVSNCQKWLTEEGVSYDVVYGGQRNVPLISNCHCYYGNEWGRFAPIIGTGTYDFNATISIDGLGSKPISSSSRSVSFGDKATFQWMGSLLGANFVTTPPYTPFREWGELKLTSTSYDGWKNTQVTSSSQYGSVTAPLKDFMSKCINHPNFVYLSQTDDCVKVYSDKTSEMIEDRKSEYIGSSPLIVDADFEGNDFIVEIEPYSTRFERFSFDINAAWLGIEYLTGDPRVSCPNDQDVFSAEERKVDLKVTNVGEGSGVFDLYLTCGRLSTDVIPDSVSLVSGGSTTVEGKLTGTFFVEEKIGCAFKAVTKKPPYNERTCYFSVEGKPREECLPGEKDCSDDRTTLLLCKDNGMWQTKAEGKFCTDGCIYVGTTAKCAEDPSCKKEDETCKDNYDCCEGLECRSNVCKPRKTGWKWNNLYLFPILLTLGLSGLFGWRGKDRTGKYYWLDFVIGGVLGLGIGFFLYWIFKNWVMILLISLLGSGLAIGLIVLLGGIPLLMFFFNILTKGRAMKARGKYKRFKERY